MCVRSGLPKSEPGFSVLVPRFKCFPAGDTELVQKCIDLCCSLAVPVVNPSFEEHTPVTGKSIQVTKCCSAWSDLLGM